MVGAGWAEGAVSEAEAVLGSGAAGWGGAGDWGEGAVCAFVAPSESDGGSTQVRPACEKAVDVPARKARSGAAPTSRFHLLVMTFSHHRSKRETLSQ